MAWEVYRIRASFRWLIVGDTGWIAPSSAVLGWIMGHYSKRNQTTTMRNNNCWSQSEDFRLNALTCTTFVLRFCSAPALCPSSALPACSHSYKSSYLSRCSRRTANPKASQVKQPLKERRRTIIIIIILIRGSAQLKKSAVRDSDTLIYGWKLSFLCTASADSAWAPSDWNICCAVLSLNPAGEIIWNIPLYLHCSLMVVMLFAITFSDQLNWNVMDRTFALLFGVWLKKTVKLNLLFSFGWFDMMLQAYIRLHISREFDLQLITRSHKQCRPDQCPSVRSCSWAVKHIRAISEWTDSDWVWLTNLSIRRHHMWGGCPAPRRPPPSIVAIHPRQAFIYKCTTRHDHQ